jgi:hypothetical protein
MSEEHTAVRSNIPSGLPPFTLGIALSLFNNAGSYAQAATAVQAINLPAQALWKSLHELAQHSRLELQVLPLVVAGKSAPMVKGMLTPETALQQLLTGSGLEAVRNGRFLQLQRKQVFISDNEAAAQKLKEPISEPHAWFSENNSSYTIPDSIASNDVTSGVPIDWWYGTAPGKATFAGPKKLICPMT